MSSATIRPVGGRPWFVGVKPLPADPRGRAGNAVRTATVAEDGWPVWGAALFTAKEYAEHFAARDARFEAFSFADAEGLARFLRSLLELGERFLHANPQPTYAGRVEIARVLEQVLGQPQARVATRPGLGAVPPTIAP
jgi:hypothetical protein